MSWIVVVWSMVASACLTLATVYGFVWYRNRSAWSHLLFAATAASTAVFTFCELWLMRVETPGELLTALKWGHVAILLGLVSIIWFVRLHLGAGRLWLAATLCVVRSCYLAPMFLLGPTFFYREVTSLRHVPLLGDYVTIFTVITSPWMLIGQAINLMIAIFVADASVTAWRRGDRRKALIIGGGVEFFVILGTLESALIYWAQIPVPILLSPFCLGMVAVMGYEVSRDVLRASQPVPALQASEAGLRESEAHITAQKHAEGVVRTLSGRLLSAQEEERRLIARELHDNLSQQLALLSIGIEELAMRSEDRATLAASLRQLGARTAEISTEVHNLSHRLHSTKLDALGLQAAVQGHCRELHAQGLQVQCLAESVPTALAYDVALCLFRVVQEGLNNVVKHSGAPEARVTLTGTNGGLHLTIADSGRGFDAATATARDGLGLASMRERVHLVGGELSVISEAGHGTTIRVRVPITVEGHVVAWPSHPGYAYAGAPVAWPPRPRRVADGDSPNTDL